MKSEARKKTGVQDTNHIIDGFDITENAAKGQPKSKLLLQVEKTTNSNIDQVAVRAASCIWDETILG
jgi:hypothetical protein